MFQRWNCGGTETKQYAKDTHILAIKFPHFQVNVSSPWRGDPHRLSPDRELDDNYRISSDLVSWLVKQVIGVEANLELE